VRDGRRFRADLLSREAGLFAGLAGGERIVWRRDQLRWMSALCAEAAGEELDTAIVAEWTVIGADRAAGNRAR
jgi:hypothetical protein